MNNCCKFELRKAMQKQTDVAISVAMAYVFIEALWQSQWETANAAENQVCAYGCGERFKDQDSHAKDCKFVAAWNGEEMTYLRYSLDIKHEVKVQ